MLMTSDGISNNDWRAIKSIAARIANATISNDGELVIKLRCELLACITSLEVKYGQKASLLATRADYVEDNQERISLLVKAYDIAQRHGDKLNMTLLCSSLADLYIAEIGDRLEGRKWLSRLEAALDECWDSSEHRNLVNLRERLLQLENGDNKLKR